MKTADRILEYLRNLILRPLAIFLLSFFVVSCVLFNVGGAHQLISSAVFFLISIPFLVLCIVRKNLVKISAAYFAAFMLLFGISLGFFHSYYTFSARLAPLSPLDGKTVSFTGYVDETVFSKSYSGMYIIKTDTLAGRENSVKIQALSVGDLSAGDKISGRISVKTLFDADGKPTEDGMYLLPNGILLTGETESVQSTGEKISSVFLRLSKIRSTLTGYLLKNLGEKSGGFSAALILGDRSYLPASVHRDFKRLGVSHILALSGMHLSVICTLLYYLTKSLNIYLRYFIQCGVIVFYILFTGFSPSVARAGIMMLLVTAAFIFRKSSDMITNIGAAVFIITLLNPFAPGDAILQLSAGAVMAIALATGNARKKELTFSKAQKWFKKRKILTYIIETLGVSLAIIVFLLPLEYLHYGYLSPLSPVLSLVLSLLATLLLWLLPFLFISFAVPVVKSAFAYVISRLCGLIFLISENVSRIPDICVTVKYTCSALICALAFVSFIVFAVSRKKVRIISAVLCVILFTLLIVGGYAYTFSQRSAELIYSGNCLNNDYVTVLCNGKATVIDVSDGRSKSITGAVSDTMDLQYTEIENIVLSHLHNYYKTSLKGIFNDGIVRNVFLPLTDENYVLCGEILELCREYGVACRTFKPGETIKLCGSFDFHMYEYGYLSRSVQPVVRFDISAGETLFTYLGSSYSELHPGEKIASDMVFLGNHGPLYKKDIDLDLSLVKQVALFDAGRDFYNGNIPKSRLILLRN